MKIVTDVGVIGLARLFETARTGIYRVISSLTTELLARDDIDISFSSLSSLQVNQLTARTLAEQGFSGKEFPGNRWENMLKFCAGLNSESPQNDLPAKVLSKLHRLSLGRRIGRQADIYHSQYSALPSFTNDRSPVKILTVYDIIPLKHPEYFADGFVDEFRPIVESFSPEKDYLFTISECTKRDVCAWFEMDPARVFVTPLAAAAELYYPVEDSSEMERVRRKFSIPDGRYVLTLATVEKRKNLQMSMDCFREIAGEVGMEIVIVSPFLSPRLERASAHWEMVIKKSL